MADKLYIWALQQANDVLRSCTILFFHITHDTRAMKHLSLTVIAKRW